MPPRMNCLLAALAFGAFAATAVPACFESGCHITAHCEGDELHECVVDNDTGSWESKTNCAANGRVCRQAGGAVACVFPDQPCAENACAGDRIAHCSVLGLVDSYLDCTADEPGRTCFAGAMVPTCGYPAIACPTSGTDAFCAPDGVSLYRGCGSEVHPLHREDCSTYDANVCTTANGIVGCANPALIPCATNESFCSADLTLAYGCGTLGLVSRTDDCAARGQICKGGWCGFDVPCDLASTDSWCSSDGSTLYLCGGKGLASGVVTCDAGKQCTERTIDGRTYADCR